jgi:hypothetical protein
MQSAGKKKPLTALQILKAARKLLSKPERWTQRVDARDAKGNPPRRRQNAVCWCARGALYHVARASNDDFTGAYQALAAADPLSSVTFYNDAVDRTHTQILAWFDSAIKRVEDHTP